MQGLVMALDEQVFRRGDKSSVQHYWAIAISHGLLVAM